MKKKKASPILKGRIWILPVALLVALTIGVSAYYASSRKNNQPPAPSMTDLPGSSQNQTKLDATTTTATEDPEWQRIVALVEQDVFYQGIWIDDLDLSGLTYEDVRQKLEQRQDELAQQVVFTLVRDKETWELTAGQLGLRTNWQDELRTAWETGRQGAAGKSSEKEQIMARYEAIQALMEKPLQLNLALTWNEALIKQQLIEVATQANVEPVGAKATAFDVSSKKFTIKDRVAGFAMDSEACLAQIVNHLAEGVLGVTIPLQGESTYTGLSAAEMSANLGKIAQAETRATNNSNRNTNIRLICESINGLVLNPGETFSFNGHVGKRTSEKGYKPAGGIVNGILEDDIVGGGICQPNTTLYHAVVKSDLEIIERYSHSWPSTYVPIGQDATVNWGGADFKFRNNTDQPVAVVAWFKNPTVHFEVYGRLLDPGVSISITSTHDGYIEVNPPVVRENKTLKPGQLVVIRAEHVGQLSTSYKVWSKDGKVLKKELLAKSRYRPIQGIHEIGPGQPETEPTTTAPTTPAETAPSTTAPTEPKPTTTTTAPEPTTTTTAAPASEQTTATTTTTPTTTAPTTETAGD